VEFVQTQIEFLDDVPHELQEEGGTEEIAHAFECPADAIVVEVLQFGGSELEQVGHIAVVPLGNAVDRFA
jgi:hypothetical protein